MGDIIKRDVRRFSLYLGIPLFIVSSIGYLIPWILSSFNVLWFDDQSIPLFLSFYVAIMIFLLYVVMIRQSNILQERPR